MASAQFKTTADSNNGDMKHFKEKPALPDHRYRFVQVGILSTDLRIRPAFDSESDRVKTEFSMCVIRIFLRKGDKRKKAEHASFVPIEADVRYRRDGAIYGAAEAVILPHAHAPSPA